METPVDDSSDVVPPKPERFDRVYDVAGDLDKSQYDRFHYDVGRLWNHDLPTVIYIRNSIADEASSQMFADEMRDTWDLETAPGADDGLVLLVTIRPTFPYSAILTYSYGSNTLPTGQMTAETLDTVREQEANPRLKVGNVNGGLTYALRRIIYYTEYTAPFPDALTDRQETVKSIALPLNIAITVLFLAIAILPVAQSLLRLAGSARTTLLLIGGPIVILAFAVAIYGESTLGTGIAFVNLFLLSSLLMMSRSSKVPPRVVPVHRSALRPQRQSRPSQRLHQRV
ncbi:MAG: hypothetical protein WKF81_08130 [Thermomicrobiales bacterium]